jgi:ABC-type phosphate/phosphonate transport system substrate-binding protein
MIILGAVAYDAKVVTIWEGIREFFVEQGAPMDFVLFSNYERQTDFLLRGKIDVAWSTPLAHVRIKEATEGRSLSVGMRQRHSHFHPRLIVRKSAGIQTPKDLAGKRLAVGSRDSTQARILPLHFLKKEGVDLGRVQLMKFDSDVGKHGDTGRSEMDVLAALNAGTADAGVVGDLIWVNEQAAGRIDSARLQSVWATPGFDHCMFDALPTLDPAIVKSFQRALFAMSWENPKHRRLLELEGLKQWLPPREEGYASLIAALADPELKP